MRASNWVVTDVVNKRADVVAHIKATTPRLSESQITQVASVGKTNRNQLFKIWEALPSQYKTKRSNLGCA